MTEFRGWLHTLHSELETNMSSSPQGWASDDEDTHSESSDNSTSFEEHLAFLCHKSNQRKPIPVRCQAAPLTIPSRTHDFGWCDRDDLHDTRTAASCTCGNDCDEIFGTSSGSQRPASSVIKGSNDDNDELIFDLEM